MYRVLLSSACVAPDLGPAAARDITEEFNRRPWHSNVRCEWDGSRIVLQADNDFDSEGLAILGEFSDAISACIKNPIGSDIKIISVHAIS
jgi:hypothetical protein